MSVDLRNCIRVRNAHMIWLDSDKGAVFLMCCVHSQVALTLPALPKEPEVREGRREGSRDAAYGPVAQVREQVVEDWNKEDSVG